MKSMELLGLLVLGIMLAGCSSTGGSAVTPAEEGAEQVAQADQPEANDGLYCRNDHVRAGSRFRARTCRTAEEADADKKEMDRNRENIRRLQDQAAQQRMAREGGQ